MIRTLVLAFIASAVALGAQQAWAENPTTPNGKTLPAAVQPKAAPAKAESAAQTPAQPAESAQPPAEAAPQAAEQAEPSPAASTPAPGDGTIPGYVAGTDLFYGRVNAMPPKGFVGEWSIAGRTVRVSDQTKVEEQGEPIKVGIRVEVIGVYSDGAFDAMILRNRRR